MADAALTASLRRAPRIAAVMRLDTGRRAPHAKAVVARMQRAEIEITCLRDVLPAVHRRFFLKYPGLLTSRDAGHSSQMYSSGKAFVDTKIASQPGAPAPHSEAVR